VLDAAGDLTASYHLRYELFRGAASTT
jgi:hypothetical protein